MSVCAGVDPIITRTVETSIPAAFADRSHFDLTDLACLGQCLRNGRHSFGSEKGIELLPQLGAIDAVRADLRQQIHRGVFAGLPDIAGASAVGISFASTAL